MRGPLHPRKRGPGQGELSLRLQRRLRQRARPQSGVGAVPTGDVSEMSSLSTRSSAWLLSDRAGTLTFFPTGFIQFNSCILATLCLCNREALELQSCWGEETPLPRRGPDSSLAGICMAQSDSSGSPSRLWRDPDPLGSPHSPASAACPAPVLAAPCGQAPALLVGAQPGPRAAPSSSHTVACQPAGRQSRGGLGAEDQISCHEVKGASAEPPPCSAWGPGGGGTTWPSDGRSAGVTGQDRGTSLLLTSHSWPRCSGIRLMLKFPVCPVCPVGGSAAPGSSGPRHQEESCSPHHVWGGWGVRACWLGTATSVLSNPQRARHGAALPRRSSVAKRVQPCKTFTHFSWGNAPRCWNACPISVLNKRCRLGRSGAGKVGKAPMLYKGAFSLCPKYAPSRGSCVVKVLERGQPLPRQRGPTAGWGSQLVEEGGDGRSRGHGGQA